MYVCTYICIYCVCIPYACVQVVGENDRVLVFSDGSLLPMMAVDIGAGKVCCLLLLLLLLCISVCVFHCVFFFIFVYWTSCMYVCALYNWLYPIYCVSVMIQEDYTRRSQIPVRFHSLIVHFSILYRSTPQRCLVCPAEFSER